MVTEIQDNQFSFILHNCGNPGHLTRSMVTTDAAGFHFGNKIDIVSVIHEVPPGRLVFWNLDPVGVFRYGSEQTVREATNDLLQRTEGHSNFVLSSGCDIPPKTPLENLDVFFESIRTFGR